MPGSHEMDDDLPAKERARERRRDRKRETRMVVDNAAVRRVQPAVQRRRAAASKTKKEPGEEAR